MFRSNALVEGKACKGLSPSQLLARFFPHRFCPPLLRSSATYKLLCITLSAAAAAAAAIGAIKASGLPRTRLQRQFECPWSRKQAKGEVDMFRRFMPVSWSEGSAAPQVCQKEDNNDMEMAEEAVEDNSKPKTKARSSIRKNLNKFIGSDNNGKSHHHQSHSTTRIEANVSDEHEEDLKAMEETVEIVHLSERQKDILKTTWTVVYGELGQALSYVGRPQASAASNEKEVTEPFLRLFEEYPMSQQFFTEFRGTPIESLRNDSKLAGVLQEHAVRVLRVVEKVIGRLEDLEKSKQYLLKLGRFHRHAGIPSDYLGVMGSIFVHAVQPYLEKHNQWNEETEDAWRELFGHITRVMTHGHIHYGPESAHGTPF